MRIHPLLALIPFVFVLLNGCGPFSQGPVITPSERVYTKHAHCRMECRSITETEVNEILETGHVNERKSDPNDKPCPTQAIEGRSSDGQLIRVVLAHCGDVDKIVTVIDLDAERDVDCHCP